MLSGLLVDSYAIEFQLSVYHGETKKVFLLKVVDLVDEGLFA
jgi:hypothetical protein